MKVNWHGLSTSPRYDAAFISGVRYQTSALFSPTSGDKGHTQRCTCEWLADGDVESSVAQTLYLEFCELTRWNQCLRHSIKAEHASLRTAVDLQLQLNSNVVWADADMRVFSDWARALAKIEANPGTDSKCAIAHVAVRIYELVASHVEPKEAVDTVVKIVCRLRNLARLGAWSREWRLRHGLTNGDFDMVMASL